MKRNAPIFLINRRQRPERLVNTINELNKVGLADYIIRKEACDIERAKELKYEYISEEVVDNIERELKSCNVIPKWEGVACAISHIEIWKRIVDENIKYAIILEDDNEIYDIDKFNWAYNDALKKIKKSEYASIFISLCSETKQGFKNFINDKIYIPNGFFSGLSFYFISIVAAKDLIKNIGTVNLQIDLEIGKFFLYNNHLSKLKLQIYDKTGIIQSKKFYSDVQFYYLSIEDIYNLFNIKYNIPYEMVEKIHFFLPNKNDLSDLVNLPNGHGFGYH
jgi:GR25 family glycosyltransferase involved in LPS biosynthesis